MTTDVVQSLAAALHPANGWEVAYPVVAHEARAMLDSGDEGDNQMWTTEETVEALWPEALARGEMILRRQRLYKALAALAEHELSDCCTKGPERKLKHGGKMIRPWLWHKPILDDIANIARATGISRSIVEKVVNAWRATLDARTNDEWLGAPGG